MDTRPAVIDLREGGFGVRERGGQLQHLDTPAVPSALPEVGRRDTHLMLRVKYHANHLAFEELMERVRPSVERPLRQALPRGEVEDGVAEVTFRVWSHRRQFREGQSTVRAWVGAIARNYANCFWRRQNLATGFARFAPPPFDTHPAPAAAAERSDWAAHVHRVCDGVLAQHPFWVRLAFALRLEGARFEDIAGVVGRPLGSVGGALHRVRYQVRALLKDNVPPIPLSAGDQAVQELIQKVLGEVADIKGKLAAVKDMLEALKGATPENLLRALGDDPAPRVERLRARIDQLLRDGAKDPEVLRSATAWAEVEDLVEALRAVRDRLPEGLFRRAAVWLKDSRRRLRKDVGDLYAVNQLRGVAKALLNA